MKRKCIKIGKPFVVNKDKESILRSVINDDGIEKVLEYRVDRKYGEYLVWERSDTFVTVLLYYAMVMDKDIEWTIPCSQQLIYQLQTYFIPVYEYELKFMHKISLIGPTTSEAIPSENRVATGLSNGVDSLYTVHRYLNYIQYEYKLTHVFFTDWYTASYPQEFHEDFLKSYLNVLPKCVEELGLEFVFVQFNIDELFSIGIIVDDECGTVVDVGLYALKYCSMAMALQKLVHIYYFSSSFNASDFTFHATDMAHHDMFTLPLISTKDLEFYSSGIETTRVEKIADIMDWEYTQRHLQVCGLSNEVNCGHCYKCIRTMTALYAYGKLDQFNKVFPIDDFKANISKRLAYVLSRAQRGQKLFCEDVALLKKNNIAIPFSAYVMSPFYGIFELAREHFRTVGWARKLFWKLHLDKLLHKNDKWNFSERMNELVLGQKDK